MRKVNLNRTFAAKAFALVLLVSLVGCLLAVPVRADVPLGAEEVEETDLNPIWIYSEAEELENLQKFVIEDSDVRGYKYGMELIEAEFEIDGKAYQCPDGELGIGEVCVYRVMQLAISQLWPIEEELPIQGDIEITWTHPCPGHEKTFKYITGDAAVYHKDVPAGTNKMNLTLDNYSYAFVRTDTGDEFTTRVLEVVFPDGFFELRTKVKSGEATQGEIELYSSQWEEVRDNFLDMEDDELFEVEEEEEEPAPVWPIVFALSLTVLVVGTTIYSVASGRIRR